MDYPGYPSVGRGGGLAGRVPPDYLAGGRDYPHGGPPRGASDFHPAAGGSSALGGVGIHDYGRGDYNQISGGGGRGDYQAGGGGGGGRVPDHLYNEHVPTSFSNPRY